MTTMGIVLLLAIFWAIALPLLARLDRNTERNIR